MSTPADVAFYGGAAGGGKTWALLMEPVRHVHNPEFACVTFRRTTPQITRPGALWDQSMKLYPQAQGKPVEYVTRWDFPSGALVQFAHMEHEKNRLDYQGTEIPLIQFDELTHFTRGQFFYMLSRNRSLCGVRPYIRATCNPVPDDDPVGGWIHEFVGWYIGEDGYAIPERSGVVRWFVMDNDALHWGDTPDELRAKFPGAQPKSFTFIRSSVYDNAILMREDPGYLANLMALPLVERERLLGGNWKVRPAAGKVFNRAWFEIVEAAPAGGRTVRFWDFAATEKKLASDDPDFTAGVKQKKVDGVHYILDCIAERLGPAEIDRLVKNTASQDGRDVAVRWEEEGGASGKRDSRYLTTMLAGFDAVGVKPQGDKLVRAKGLAAQAQVGNVKLVRGAWNERWLTHMHAIPDGAHDDIMDASSGGFNFLTDGAAEVLAENPFYQ